MKGRSRWAFCIPTETPIYLGQICTPKGWLDRCVARPKSRETVHPWADPQDGIAMVDLKGEDRVTANHVEMNLKMAYIKTRRDHNSRVLEGFVTLLGHFQKSHLVLAALLQEAADLIRSMFSLRYVMIGLKRQDGTYRYECMSGMRDDSWAAHKKKVYTLESFSTTVPGWYSAGVISSLTRIYLEEKNPLGPGYENSVNRPALLSMERSSVDTCLEADFFNTLIRGSRGELLGWVEYPGTIGNKMPDATVIRNIEVVASILAAAITSEERKRRPQ